MADHKSAQPVRSEADGTDERLHVKLVDGTTPAQRAIVDIDGNLHTEMHGNNPAGTDTVQRLAENGSAAVDGVYDVAANTDPANIGLVAQTRNAASADSRQVERITAKRGTTDTDRVCIDTSLHDENGNSFSMANPLPVVVANDEGGTPVDQYTATTDIAKDASLNTDYTVPVTGALTLKAIHVSSSARMKVEISVGAAGGPTAKWTKFITSSEPNVLIEPKKNEVVAVGDIVRVRCTNIDQQAAAAYITIEGTLGA